MSNFSMRGHYIALTLGLIVAIVGIFVSVDASGQMISVGQWKFEQKIDGQIGHIIGCRTNVPAGGSFSDTAMRNPVLKARAEVGESTNPYSNCSAHVMAEADLLVMQQPTLVELSCESRGGLAVEREPGMASISATASIMDVRGTGSFTNVNCSPARRTAEGVTQVIEFDRKQVCLTPADYVLSARLHVDAEIGLGATYEVAEANMLDRIPSTGFHVFVEAVGSCPSLPAFGGVEEFDMDNDAFLSDREFFAVVDAWINGQISEMEFFAAIDFWINITPLPVRASEVVALSTTATRTNMIFAASAGDQLNVEIFGLNGKQIFSAQSAGQQLRWGYQSASGGRVANGVYLAKIDVLDSAGQLISSEIKRVLVIN